MRVNTRVGVAIAVALVCSLTGCNRGPRFEALTGKAFVQFLDGRYVTGESVSVVPDQYWVPHPDPENNHWSFVWSATLLVRVHRVPDDRLAFWFVPDEHTRRFHLDALWDDEPLLLGPVQPSADGSLLSIPPELLTPGDHRLTLRRRKDFDDPSDRDRDDNSFVELGWRLGFHRTAIRTEDRHRLGMIADFFDRGLTGGSESQFSGCLFDGKQQLAAEVISEGPSSLFFTLENQSSKPARFILKSPESTLTEVVEAGAIEPVEFALGEGHNRLVLRVTGEKNGLYLWGGPYLRSPETALPGPIVLVTLDTTRRDAVSVYGGPEHATPRIEEFSRHATVYESAHAASPWTLPSHASMFTGLYPSHHGAGVSEDHLPARFDSLAALLRRRGYLTAGFAGGEMSSSRWGVGNGFAMYRNPEGFETRGDRLTDAAIEFLDRHHEDPFFLFVNYFDPHAMYDAPEEFERRFNVAALREPLVDRPVWGRVIEGEIPAWRAAISGRAEVDQDVLDYLRAAYLAEVAFMDYQIGRLFDALREYGLYDNSLIALVSDHGEFLGEDGFFSHCCRLDPELTEIPLLVKFPGQREPLRVAELVTHVDVFATLAGGSTMPAHDGISLGADGAPARKDRRTVFMEEHRHRIHPLFENMKIADHLFGLQRLRSREIVWNGGIRCSERVGSIWNDAICPTTWSDRLDELAAFARSWESTTGDQERVLSDEERERLEALGYVE